MASRLPSSRSTTLRSTTSAATDARSRRAGILAAILVAESLAAAMLLSRPSAPQVGPAPPVGGDRMVSTTSMGGIRTDLLLNRVRARMPDAVSAVERFWGTDWTTEIQVVATGSQAQFAAWGALDPQREWSDIAAVSVADAVDPGRGQASGQRIVLAPGAADMSDSALAIVLTHELFHVAARSGTALDAPRWITEGVADFVARPPEALPPGAADVTVLPSDADLDTPGPDRSAGYDRAWWFARFVADTYGTDGLRRFYNRACGPGHADLAAAVHTALGVDLDQLQVRWADWLRANLNTR